MKRLSDYKALSEMNNYETLARPVYIVNMENMINNAKKNQCSPFMEEQISR